MVDPKGLAAPFGPEAKRHSNARCCYRPGGEGLVDRPALAFAHRGGLRWNRAIVCAARPLLGESAIKLA